MRQSEQEWQNGLYISSFIFSCLIKLKSLTLRVSRWSWAKSSFGQNIKPKFKAFLFQIVKPGS